MTDELNDPTTAGASDVAANAEPQLTAEEQLAAAQNEIAALKDQHLRAVAEQENIRKRNVQDVQNAREFAVKEFAFSLLTVKDTLEMVLKDEQSSVEQIKIGVDMTLKNLTTAFDRARVKEVQVKTEQTKFDPNIHQAMTQIESTTADPGTVLQVFQKGYTLAERVLRPAMVAVAKATEAPAAPGVAAENSGNAPVESQT